jgi:hypothetical protein
MRARRAFGAVLLALGFSVWAEAQKPVTAVAERADSCPKAPKVAPDATRPDSGSGGQIVREIVDRSTGERWLLLRDSGHPGGPGRLVLAGEGAGPDTDGGAGTSPPADSGLANSAPVIRAGDRLVIEEHTRLVEAHLEGVALGPAAAGSALSVRLKMGGKVIRAMALGPGRAALEPETGGRP